MSTHLFTTRCGILLTALFMYCHTLSAQVNSLPGSGTTADPYRISTVAELKWMRDKVNADNGNYGNKVYKLMEDLNFKDEGDWTPIGDYSNPTITFKGTFDGNNKKIIAIKIGPSVTPNNIIYAGLFGYIVDGSVTNLGVDWTGIYSYSLNSANVGGIVGCNYGTIVNCYSSGIISAMSQQKSAYAGGIVGWNGGKITNCYSVGSVTASTQELAIAGGIVGFDQKGIIANCYASGSIQATGYYAYAGGIAGQNISSTITNCFAINKLITAISITKNYFANRISTLSELSSTNYASFNLIVKVGISAADLTQLTNLDGLNHGINFEGMPLNQLNNWVKNNPATYGIVNNSWKLDPVLNNGYPIFELPIILPPVTSLPGSGTTTDPYRISTVAELKFMRDRVNVGNADYVDKAYKLMADLDFTGEASWIPIGLGSFKGTFDGRGKVIRNITCGSLSSPSNYMFAGLFGYLDGASIMKLGVEWKEIYASFSYANVGGIAGYIKTGNITDCYSTGPIITVTDGNAGSTSQSSVGGIVGMNFGQITNCYSIGSITASSSPSSSYAASGGIVGINIGQIINCYSMRDVSATSSGNAFAGGIAGTNNRTDATYGQITNCYANGNILASAIANNAYSGGIAGQNPGSILNCLALNSSITSIAGTSKAIAKRISSYGTLTNNYASTNIIVKQGTSSSDLTSVTNFFGPDHGTNLTGLPVTLLNSWVTSNPIINGITIKTWEAVTGINNGFPYFMPIIYNPPIIPTGSGTISDPYCISTIGNLKWVRDKVNNENSMYGNKAYKLLADLDFEEEGDWDPIGNSIPFTGIFEGNNKVIRNIHIGTPTTPSTIQNAGLFGKQNGTISNLGIEWTGIYTTAYAGGIAGLNSGILFNCHTSGELSGSLAGGIAGENHGPITNCYSSGSVTGISYSGGITGWNFGPITNCYTSGLIAASSFSSPYNMIYSGGIAGENRNIISNSYASGPVSASSAGYAYACGIANNYKNSSSQIEGNIINCLALNSSISSIASAISNAYAFRIGNYQTNGTTINFASNSIAVKTGTSQSNLTAITTFNDGVNNIDQPLKVLNDWVDKTKITSTGQELYSWKVIEGINGGYPIFDSVIMPLLPLQGAGTANDPFLIYTVADLWTVTVKVKNENAMYGNKVYKLMADLDFSGQGDWVPIGGTDSLPSIGRNSFKGTFDGNGKEIRNIKIGTQINNSTIDCAGLFGYIKGGKVINLGVVWNGIHINPTSNLLYLGNISGGFVGGIAGFNDGIISNCWTMGTLASNASSGYIGGIAGNNLGTINNTYSSVIASSNGFPNSPYTNINFDTNAGGISGKNSGTISNCFSTGQVSAICAGGIVGENCGSDKKRAIITNCYSSGSLTALSDYDLGKSGYSSLKIYAGGISGTNKYGKIKNCVALNPSITSISKSTDQANTYRIVCNLDTTIVSDNYALASMIVKTGKSVNELVVISNFTGPYHGADFNGKPLAILNDWVNGNPATNGLPNKQWKLVDGTNNGLPIFEDQLTDRFLSFNLSGYGNSSDPYRINNMEDLKLMRDLVNYNNIDNGNRYYRLISDLNCVDLEDWAPIGASAINSFKGTFDGNGKVIKNIKIGSSTSPLYIDCAGLFGYIKEGNVINLGVNWAGIFSFSKNAGGIAGVNDSGIIKNCYTKGQFSQYSNSINAGGIVGYNTGYFNTNNGYGEITNCYSRVNVMANAEEYADATLSAGGIVGTCEDGRMTNCYSTGSIMAITRSNQDQSTRAGGISGWTFGQANYCIALNSSIVAIAGSNTAAWSYRIGWLGGMNNFASPTIDIKNGTSEANLTGITDFSQGFNNSHGSTLTETPVILLNNWVTETATTNNIPNKRWKVLPNVNDGYPIFEDQIIDGINPIEMNKMNSFHIYGGKGVIVVDGERVGKIKVFDIKGQLILQHMATENHTLLNVDKNGPYVVVVLDPLFMKPLISQTVIVIK